MRSKLCYAMVGVFMLFITACMDTKLNSDKEIMETKVSQAPFVGVTVSKSDRGVRLDAVVETSPFATAGLEMGDKILAIGENEITNVKSFARSIAQLSIDKPTNIKIFTKSAKEEVVVVTPKRTQNQWVSDGWFQHSKENHRCPDIDRSQECIPNKGLTCTMWYKYEGEGPNGGVLLKLCCRTTGQGMVITQCWRHPKEYF